MMNNDNPSIEFLEWAFKQKYANERELLLAMLQQTESWYNEIANPLKDALYENYRNGWKFTNPDPTKYESIAKELYFKKIESNHGNQLSNTIEQLKENEIPLFQSRYKLIKRTREFLDSGRFVKNFMSLPKNWNGANLYYQHLILKDLRYGWENFKTCKDRLVTEINRQIRRLDAPLNKSITNHQTASTVTTIVFLSADPTNTSRLRLGEEFREIEEQLALGKKRDFYKLALPQLSLRARDITK